MVKGSIFGTTSSLEYGWAGLVESRIIKFPAGLKINSLYLYTFIIGHDNI